jgi:hypothetical protein
MIRGYQTKAEHDLKNIAGSVSVVKPYLFLFCGKVFLTTRSAANGTRWKIAFQTRTTAALTGLEPTGISMNSGPFFQCAAAVTLLMRITAISPDAWFSTSAY